MRRAFVGKPISEDRRIRRRSQPLFRVLMARAQNLGQRRLSRGFAKAHEIIDRAIDLRLFDARFRRSACDATRLPRVFF
ncbi:hypothetical protein C5688_02950 [Methylocystis sp. MitZ-2018]|nr:hypothetical protein C5688_02950 [Methylocystis sp. MitZ-2018]